MQCHRMNELLELVKEEWANHQNDNLMTFLANMAKEAGHQGNLADMNDDTLIYHLKMRNRPQDEMIPGIAKDCVDDFKSAILKARGIDQ